MKRQAPRKPAAPVSEHDELRKIEGGFKERNFIKKVFISEGPDAARAAMLNLWGTGPAEDVGATSIGGQADIQNWIDPQIERGKR